MIGEINALPIEVLARISTSRLASRQVHVLLGWDGITAGQRRLVQNAVLADDLLGCGYDGAARESVGKGRGAGAG